MGRCVAVALLCGVMALSGCARVAVQAASGLVPDMTAAFFEECDVQLARQSLPGQLKLLEGLLKSAPGDPALLMSLSMGYTGYALLFVEESDPERASQFYLRARSYGFRALGLSSEDPGELAQRLDRMKEEQIDALFWTTLAWNGWINLNLDKPLALAELTLAQQALEKILQLGPDHFYGTPYLLHGTLLAAKPQMLGGDPAMARRQFEKGLAVASGRFFLAHYLFARWYAVGVQDRALFMALTEEVKKARPDDLKEACLINSAMKERTLRLQANVEELFF